VHPTSRKDLLWIVKISTEQESYPHLLSGYPQGDRVRHSSFNPERHRRQTHTRLLLGGALVLVGIGGGLVWVFYGGGAAITAVACLAAAGGLFGLLWVILTLLERWVKEDS
jgi:hypothetical protein